MSNLYESCTECGVDHAYGYAEPIKCDACCGRAAGWAAAETQLRKELGLSEDSDPWQALALREAWLAAWPEMREYFAIVSKLCARKQ